jgi:hypothetical protein
MTDFEEIDYQRTRLGELILRRRTQLSLGIEVYEVKLNDEWLMSSLFTEGEIALARLALQGLKSSDPAYGRDPWRPLDVAVGGLGLGYTARAVLDDPQVNSLLVVEALPEVIGWHRKGLVPLGAGLAADPRCKLAAGDFFALLETENLDPEQPGRRFDAILVDIDHSPRHVLHPSHELLYTTAGLRSLGWHLQPGGVFALWSNDPPDEEFRDVLQTAFAQVDAQVVRFHNPLQNREATNTIYLARTGEGA